MSGTPRGPAPPILDMEDGTSVVPLMSSAALEWPQDFALIDTADADLLRPYWFCLSRPPHARTSYAKTYVFRNGREMSTGLHQILIPGAPEIDHRDGDGLNNRRSNLRVATHSENNRNRVHHKPGRSGFKGASPSGRKFAAQIRVNARACYLGTYDTALEAAFAYDRAARRLHGEFASPNFPLPCQ